MPHRLDAMKYMHSPLATLKNMTPMKIIMYFIIFCCMAACSSAGGGIIFFCCQRNSTIVIDRQDVEIRAQSEECPRPLVIKAGMNAGPIEEHVRAGQVRAPADGLAEQRGLPQLDVDHQRRDTSATKIGNWMKRQQAAAQGVVVVLAEQLLLGLGAGLDVVLVFLLEPLDLRLELLHLAGPRPACGSRGTCTAAPAR